MICALAIRTQHTNQSLRQHTVERRHEVVRLNAHVQETSDHVDHVIRVYSCKYEVTSQRGLNRDLGGLRIANLADHDLVRVVTQNRTQTTIECESLFLVDGNLRDAV